MTTRVLLLENIHPDASARLAKEGYQVDTLPRALGEDELIEAIGDVSMLGIRSGTRVTERVLAAAPQLVAVGAFCRQHRHTHLLAALLGCHFRRLAQFHVPEDVLQHDHRVVDQAGEDNGKTGQHHAVNGASSETERDDRRQSGKRNGEKHRHRPPQTAQKQQHHRRARNRPVAPSWISVQMAFLTYSD